MPVIRFGMERFDVYNESACREFHIHLFVS